MLGIGLGIREFANSITGLKEVYTTDEVVRILGISKPTLFKRIREDKIKPYGDREAGSGRIGYRFKREEIEKFGKTYNIEPDWSAVIDSSSFNANEHKIKNSIVKNALETYQLELRQLKLTTSEDEKSEKENELKEISIRLKIKEIKGRLLSDFGLLEKRLNLLYSDFDAFKDDANYDDYENFGIEQKNLWNLLNQLRHLVGFAGAIEKGERRSYEEYVESKEKKAKEEFDAILEKAKNLTDIVKGDDSPKDIKDIKDFKEYIASLDEYIANIKKIK